MKLVLKFVRVLPLSQKGFNVSTLRRFFRSLMILTLAQCALFSAGVHAAEADLLARSFLCPPASARPWVFWFWLNGNLSSNGITADLEAMKRVGLGGVVIMEVDQGTPKGPVAFGSPAWLDLFRHVCSEAHRLGLQVSMNNDAGWCGSGGPWITPELSMQKLVWSEKILKGPAHFEGDLPQPETIRNFYRDIAVVAFSTLPEDEVKMTDASPKLTSSLAAGDFEPQKLLDSDLKTAVVFPRPQPAKPQFVQLEFPQPFRARWLKLTLPGLSAHKMCRGALQISDDGREFQTIGEFDADASVLSVNFNEVAARYYRILFTRSEWYLERLLIAEVELGPQFRIDNIEAKALFITQKEPPARTNHAVFPEKLIIHPDRMVNLTSRLSADGRLTWDVPSGTWTLLRFGHTSTGEDNQPAPESGRGLECDKLSKTAAEAAFNGLMGKLTTAIGPLAGKTLVGTHIDSWEVGSQNWTPKFPQEFRRRRGYDLLPFLPVMTGRVIDNLEISQRFLWDLRQTVSDLIVDNYAGHFHDLANHHGLRLSMEAYDLNPCDDLAFAGRADQPMAEFWSWPPYAVAYSCIEMASAAHVYGKPIVSGEALTATDAEKWVGHPFAVKVFGDWAFCHGINRFVLHRFAHQPWTEPGRSPGMSMGPWGLHYERTQTWWEQSRPWHQYLSRCQYLLQQGLFVADICYVALEQSPQQWQVPGKSRERPGYNFDGCPPQVVLTRMSVKHGRIVLPDGASYRLLVLPESDTMTPQLLAKIKKLVEAGATVLGPRPFKSPSLSGFPTCDASVSRLAQELWGDCDGKTVKEHRFGKGKVLWGPTPQEVLAAAGVPPDFEAQTKSVSQPIRYTHRVIGDTDLYFLANDHVRNWAVAFFEDTVCGFRIHNKRPALWWPDTGHIDRPAVYDEAQGTVRVPIRFDPNGSLFVVFRPGQPIESDRITSVNRNGQPLLETIFQPHQANPARTNKDYASTFTIAVWAKPEVEIDLPEEGTAGIYGEHAIRNDALYPPPGQDVYSAPNHAGSGLSVGRNGLCVFEQAEGYFAPPLVYAVPLTTWTHIAVVYQENKPSLYLNGKFVREGLKSNFTVHSGVGVQHRRGIGPFRGVLGELQNFDRALTATEIQQLMEATPIPGVPSEIPELQIARGQHGEIQAQVWRDGSYVSKTAAGKTLPFAVSALPSALELAGPWTLEFPPHQGAPERATLDNLISWSDHSDPGVRYFSGTATYHKTFTVPSTLVAKIHRLYLDLGKVAVIAQVNLNGHDLGTLWKPPFRADVTEAINPGQNALEVKVVNLWPNRMIGDEQLPEDSQRNPNGTLKQWPRWLLDGQPSPTGRFTFTSWRLWKKDSPLQQSGLLGPVTIIAAIQTSLAQP